MAENKTKNASPIETLYLSRHWLQPF